MKRRTKALAVAALLIAIATIVKMFTVSITSILEIRLGTFALAAAGALLGPVYGTGIGAISDILGYIVRPTGPFFPGFTISAAATGLIFGLILRKKHDLPRIIIAVLVNAGAVTILLNSLWLSMLYGNAFIVVLGARIVKELVLIPVNIVLIFLIMKALDRAGITASLKSDMRKPAPAKASAASAESGQQITQKTENGPDA